MQYSFTGIITEVGSITPCIGKVREKCTFVVRDNAEDRDIAFILFDDNIKKLLEPLEIGDKVKVDFTIKTKKYTDKFGNTTYPTSCFASWIEKIPEPKKRTQSNSRQQQSSGPFGHAGDNNFWEEWAKKQQGKTYSSHDPHNPPPWEQPQQTSDWFIGCKNAQDAKKRYRELCKKHHPDLPGGSTEKMQTINKQYDRWK